MYKFLLLTLLLVAFQAKAQQSVLFRVKYLPNHNYSSSFIIGSNTQMNIEADKEILEKIKEKGIKLPLVILGNTEMDYKINTGAINDHRSFPIVISYTNIKSDQTINGEEKISPPSPLLGMSVYCHYDENGKMQMDSIPGKNVSETIRSTMYNMIKSFQDHIKFPDSPIKIGDTFSQELPMSFPIEGNTFNIVVKIIYKLSVIKANRAYFDLDQTATFNFTNDKMTVNMVGKGNGKMVFDIVNSFSLSTASNLKFDYTMQIEKMTVKGSAIMSSTHKTDMN